MKQIRVMWRFENKFGRVYLDGMNLTVSMVSRLTPELISMSFSSSSGPTTSTFGCEQVSWNRTRCCLGRFHQLGFSVTNRSSDSFPVRLTITHRSPTQCYSNVLTSHSSVFSHHQGLLSVGNVNLDVQLGSSQTYTNKIAVCFLAVGQYQFVVHCQKKKSQQQWKQQE